jgi:hypothetical protein
LEKKIKIKMKKFLLGIAAIFCISAGLLVNIYEALNIDKDDAKKLLLVSMASGFVNNEGHPDLVSDARKLSPQDRAEGVRQLIQLAKEYTKTEEFKKDYKKWRNNKLNPETKTKLGFPKLGKMLENKIDNQVDKSENEKRYPADPVEMLQKRLADFLRISATVDFDAEVQNRMFVKPEYEKKGAEWKMCYRAGREVVEAAREEAQKWLDEISSK